MMAMENGRRLVEEGERIFSVWRWRVQVREGEMRCMYRVCGDGNLEKK
ncbi:hypothetical protein COLO4_15117 [Corchorus olitorius]|uniref:Uncharacterized protein n=1 Tax=Corchorus olitorius TaxID=93759 RepID=A0A1R3JPH3_9ROSI|nr:hypothetical protein COLO4_15117 [Corchorus olitorius]